MRSLSPMKQARRLFWFLISTVFVCALLGGIYGRRVEATTAGSDDSDIKAGLEAFSRVYHVVEQNYADPVDPDQAIFGPTTSTLGAIPGMLRTLDPHSNFFDPRAYAQLREDQAGKYSGVGMQIQARPGKMGKLITVVITPLPGSPAFRAGLRPGDLIVRVDGKSTEGLNTPQVAEMLKGPKGTVVHVTAAREGSDESLEFTIVRDEISKASVDDAFQLRPGVGYIRIINFDETTNEELTSALKKLDDSNLQGLVLDMRNNPGGLLQEAVQVADHFLEKHQLIVYHYGRNSNEKRYYATKGDRGNEYPIVVLINRLTASAAEIVTGALQDHDRALVMGEPSFGKGLVQTVYPLSEHTGLALTTAHYYTPTGRLIQREYSGVSPYDYYLHYQESGTPSHPDVRRTDAGREVFGGGGITPDVAFHEPPSNPLQVILEFRRQAFLGFALNYLRAHGGTVPRDFLVDDAVVADFRKYLASEEIPLTARDYKDNSNFINGNIRAQLLEVVYGQAEGDKVKKEYDPMVQKALEEMPVARELLARLHRVAGTKGPGL